MSMNMSVMPVCSWRQIACCEVSTSFAAAQVCHTLPPRLSWESGLGSCWSHHCPSLVWSHWGCAVVLSSSAWHHCFVGVGVLLGVGHTIVLLVEMPLVFLKLKKKKITSGTGRWHLPALLVVTSLVPCITTFIAISVLILTWWWQLFLLLQYLVSPSCHCSSHSLLYM